VQLNHEFLAQLCRETGQRHFVARSGPSWLSPDAQYQSKRMLSSPRACDIVFKIGTISTVFKFKLILDGRYHVRSCVKHHLCQSLPVTQQMRSVRPEALAAYAPERAAPGGPFRLCEGQVQTRPLISCAREFHWSYTYTPAVGKPSLCTCWHFIVV